MEFNRSLKSPLSEISCNSRAIKKQKYNGWSGKSSSPNFSFISRYVNKSPFRRNSFNTKTALKTYTKFNPSRHNNKVNKNENSSSKLQLMKLGSSNHSPCSRNLFKKSPLRPKDFLQELDDIVDIDDDDDDMFLSSKYDNLNKRNDSLVNVPSISSNADKENILGVKPINIKPDCSSKLECLTNQPNYSEKAEINIWSSKRELRTPTKLGFTNLGNTCYINAVLQTLICLSHFTKDLTNLWKELGKFSSSLSLVKSLIDIISARERFEVSSIDEYLQNIKKVLERVDPSFSGSKMHDASEFLTTVVDMLKKEIDDLSKLEKEYKEKENTSSATTSHDVMPNGTKITIFDFDKDISSLFETPDSSCSPASPILQRSVDNQRPFGGVRTSKLEPEISDENTLQNQSVKEKLLSSGKGEHDPDKVFENPIVKHFEFKFFESYMCLGCGSADGRTQEHYALYVDLPDEESEDCSLQDAIKSSMKGEKRERKCEKCEQSSSFFISKFIKVPRVLIVNLKRFKFNSEEMVSTKVANKVKLDLTLHLDSFIAQDAVCSIPHFKNFKNDLSLKSTLCSNKCEKSSESKIEPSSCFEEETNTTTENERIISSENQFAYQLVSVVSHLGFSTSGGHYVSDVHDIEKNQWFHCNDESVSKLGLEDLLDDSRQSNGYIFVYIHQYFYEELKKA